ncbi:MAG: DUF5678 domain-containing protein [Euryarchaeota archaeon]|nr:DUF5678 domain-containing protein [Euryarchaeota archaeon]
MEEIMIPEGFWDDQEWGFRHHTKLLETYRDVWVAIVDKVVVAAGKDLGKVEKEAKKKTGRDPAVMFVESGSHIY